MHFVIDMRAGELCVRDVVTAFQDESVIEAARRMAEYDVGDLIVVVDRPAALPRPIGIVTDRDLVVQVLAEPKRTPASVKVGDVMSHDLVVAREADDVDDVVARMRERAIRRIPIVDDEGGLQGLLSLTDISSFEREASRRPPFQPPESAPSRSMLATASEIAARSPRVHPASASELRDIPGEVEPLAPEMLPTAGATTGECAEARSALQDEDSFGDLHHAPSNEREAAVRAILEDLLLEELEERESEREVTRT